MRFAVQEGQTSATIYVGENSILAVQHLIDHVRAACGQGEDILTSLPWFLAHAHRSEALPVIVVLHTRDNGSDAPVGALLLHGRKVVNIPTGMFKAGYLCGRGAAIGPRPRRPWIAETAARLLISKLLAHTVLVTLAGDGVSAPDSALAEAAAGPWRMRETRCVLSLEGGMDGLYSRLSYKMRRNFRYYRQRAERDLGCTFLPDLTAEEHVAAVEALHARSARPQTRIHALQHAAALQAVPGGFAMGLKDGSGNWLSYLAGWRQPDASSIEWQLNVDDMKTSSLTTAMRHYWLEHEVSLGTPRVIFVGETSPAWSRPCERDWCGDLLLTTKGAAGVLIKTIVQRLSPTGQVASLYQKPGTIFQEPPTP